MTALTWANAKILVPSLWCPRRDTPQMGTAMTCGNVEGMLVVDQELALPSHDEKA